MRDELQEVQGYYRPKYEQHFENDFYRYNVKLIKPHLHGNVQMKNETGKAVKASPRKLDGRSIRKLAEINLGLRQYRSTMAVESPKMKPHFSRRRSKEKSTYAKDSQYHGSVERSTRYSVERPNDDTSPDKLSMSYLNITKGAASMHNIGTARSNSKESPKLRSTNKSQLLETGDELETNSPGRTGRS